MEQLQLGMYVLVECNAFVLCWYSMEIPASRRASFTHNSKNNKQNEIPSHFSQKGLQHPPPPGHRHTTT
jgi:hypothetical protein